MSEKKRLTGIIAASSVGTMIEWYDFYIFGSLATVISTKFFPSGNPTAAILSTLATFAAGFIVRPFGALFFGRIGDLIGRKYTFMVTLLLMGLSTAFIGMIPDYETIGFLAPILVLTLRLLQGLALGGEYGGAATYVAEHSPQDKRGFWTSWIQTTATVGLFISLAVIIVTKNSMEKAEFERWGWRVPFLLSFVMLGISYYIRKGMHESPLFQKIKTEGTISKNPLKDSFAKKLNFKYVLLALLGATMGQGVVWYTGQFYAMGFLKTTMNLVEQTDGIIITATMLGTPFFILFGSLSDKLGRKWIMMVGMFLAIICYRPIYSAMYAKTNLATKSELIEKTTVDTKIVPVLKENFPTGDSTVTVTTSKEFSDGTLYTETNTSIKYAVMNIEPAKPVIKKSVIVNISDRWTLVFLVLIQVLFVTMVYGPIAAFLVELFPTKIRYTSMSLPYHIGNGVFGGLLPTISLALTLQAKELKDPEFYLNGLWYPIIIAAVSLIIGSIYLREGKH